MSILNLTMDSFLILLPLLCSILFIYIWVSRFLIKTKAKLATWNLANGKLQLPPGSYGWPFLGEILEYVYCISKGVPEKFVQDRRKRYCSRIFKTSFAGEPVAILCGAEGNKFLFSNERKVVRLWWPPAIDQMFPKSNNKTTTEEQIKMRRAVSPFLKPDALRQRVGLMVAAFKKELQTHLDNYRLQVSAMAKKYASNLACQILLGITDSRTIDDFAKLIEDVADGLHSLPVNFPGTAFSGGLKASKIFRQKVEKMVKQRKIELAENCSASPQDIVGHMLQATDENGQFLNEFDIASHLLSLIEGSFGNVHRTITLIMMNLAERPDIYDSVLREQMKIADSRGPTELLTWEDLSKMKYTWNVACETLRLLPPLGMFREAVADFEYAGYMIPKGWKIHWVARATHSDPKYFPDPEKFDPSRFEGKGPAPYSFVPFGGGSRMCPGTEYARLAILVFTHNMVTRFRWAKLSPEEKIAPGLDSGPAYGLPVQLHPHKF